jgi:hypothetical protein
MYSIDVKTEVRKIANSKPVHAAAGAGVLATQALRELPGRLVRTIDGTVNTLPGRATETVTSLPWPRDRGRAERQGQGGGRVRHARRPRQARPQRAGQRARQEHPQRQAEHQQDKQVQHQQGEHHQDRHGKQDQVTPGTALGRAELPLGPAAAVHRVQSGTTDPQRARTVASKG